MFTNFTLKPLNTVVCIINIKLCVKIHTINGCVLFKKPLVNIILTAPWTQCISYS